MQPITKTSKPHSLAKTFDDLRLLHEDLRKSMMHANKVFVPQICLHLVIEILVVVMHFYSVIISFSAPLSIFAVVRIFIDVIFIITHSTGIVLFLTINQKITNLVIYLFTCLIKIIYINFIAKLNNLFINAIGAIEHVARRKCIDEAFCHEDELYTR